MTTDAKEPIGVATPLAPVFAAAAFLYLYCCCVYLLCVFSRLYPACWP